MQKQSCRRSKTTCNLCFNSKIAALEETMSEFWKLSVKCFDTFWKGIGLFWNYIFVILSWLKYFMLIYRFIFFSAFKKKTSSNNLFFSSRENLAKKIITPLSISFNEAENLPDIPSNVKLCFEKINKWGEVCHYTLWYTLLMVVCILSTTNSKNKGKSSALVISPKSVMLWITSSDSDIVPS